MKKMLFFICILTVAMGFSSLAIANTHSISLNGAQYLSRIGVSLTGNNTFETWVKPFTQPATNSIAALTNNDNLSSKRSYDFYYVDEAGNKKIKVFFSQDLLATKFTIVSWDYNLPSFLWSHLAIATTISNPSPTKCILYINGVSQGYGTFTEVNGGATSIASSSASLEIGRFANGTNYFNGLMDETRLWNKTRSSSEIVTNYQKEMIGNEDGLTLYNNFNNTLGTLTNNGGATFSTDVPFTGAIPEEETGGEETTTTITPCPCEGELEATKSTEGILLGSATSSTAEFINVGHNSTGIYTVCVIDLDGNTLATTTLPDFTAYTMKSVGKKNTKAIAIQAYLNGAKKIISVDFSTTPATITVKTIPEI